MHLRPTLNCSTTCSTPLLLLAFLLTGISWVSAQPPSSASPPAGYPPAQATQKPPALVDPAGPAVSLQTSEALFDIATALNACGYDDELGISDPVRAHVRAQVNEALQESAPGRDSRDQLCAFIGQHRLAETG